MKQQTAKPPLLTGGVARRLNVSTRRVQQLEQAGVLTAIRAGGVRLFDSDQVERVRRDRLLAKQAKR